MLIDEATVRKLQRLAFQVRRARLGAVPGERRSTHRGASQEYADFRAYAPGDDLRRVDWKAAARLDRVFLKLFEDEQDLQVVVCLDASASMDWGAEETHKFRYALRLAAAAGVISLSTGDAFSILPIQAGKTPARFGPARGPAWILPLFDYLEKQTAGGPTDLQAGLSALARQGQPPGLVILISDLFAPGDPPAWLAPLQSRGAEVVVFHLLAPEELDPGLDGDLRLVDRETGAVEEVSLDASQRDLYRRRVAAWRQELQAGFRRRGIRCLELSTGLPWESVYFQSGAQAGVLR